MQFWFVLECNDAAIKTDVSKASCQVYKNTGRERKRQGERYCTVCGFVCVLWMLRVYFEVLPTLVLCARQSPCQFSGLHHLSGLALGHRQSPLWLRLDFVADQWDLWGQTDCHCILPCMLPKLNLFVLLLISTLPAWILTRTGTAGREATEGGYFRFKSVPLLILFSIFQGVKKSCFLLLQGV